MQNNEKPIVLSAVLLIISVVVAFLLIQQASIPQGSRVEIRVSRESRAALALSDSHALRQSI